MKERAESETSGGYFCRPLKVLMRRSVASPFQAPSLFWLLPPALSLAGCNLFTSSPCSLSSPPHPHYCISHYSGKKKRRRKCLYFCTLSGISILCQTLAASFSVCSQARQEEDEAPRPLSAGWAAHNGGYCANSCSCFSGRPGLT